LKIAANQVAISHLVIIWQQSRRNMATIWQKYGSNLAAIPQQQTKSIRKEAAGSQQASSSN
jgi:hypothetical protein